MEETSLQHRNTEQGRNIQYPFRGFSLLCPDKFCKLVSLADTDVIKSNRGIKGRKLVISFQFVGWQLLAISAHLGMGGGHEDPRS